jgi:hypothetical protein
MILSQELGTEVLLVNVYGPYLEKIPFGISSSI